MPTIRILGLVFMALNALMGLREVEGKRNWSAFLGWTVAALMQCVVILDNTP